MQILGAGLLLWTPWDLKEFIGLRQWERQRKGEEEAQGRNERLFTGKGYGLVRHPLYLGCSLLLAFHPVQTRNSAATAAAVVAYFYIGTFFEERRMVRKFGEAYREYQRRVSPRTLRRPGCPAGTSVRTKRRRLHQQGEDGPLGEREDGAGRDARAP